MIDFDKEPPIDTFKNSQLYPVSDKVISCLCRIKGNKQFYVNNFVYFIINNIVVCFIRMCDNKK